MDPIIERSVFEPDDGHFLYWKPGGIPYSEPPGFSWRLDPGNDLVLNAHMIPSGSPSAHPSHPPNPLFISRFRRWFRIAYWTPRNCHDRIVSSGFGPG